MLPSGWQSSPLNPFKGPVRKKRHLLSSSYPSNHFLLLLSPYHGPGTLPRAKALCFSVLLLMTVHACAQSLSGVWLFATPWTVAPPGSSVHGILQARTLEWVAISFSKGNYRRKESEVAQSCLTLCDPTDCSLPGSPIHGIFRARVLEWVAISFSRAQRNKAPPSIFLSSIFFPIWGDKLLGGKTTLVSAFRKHWFENSLVVQWLGLSIPTAEGLSSISGRVTKIPQVASCGQN